MFKSPKLSAIFIHDADSILPDSISNNHCKSDIPKNT
ncbi:hypothetical protein K08M3_31690 [Vibrio alginolyticus]|uniref:Uncharacterized protein n=1 Tax=Vibrio alginolyticus TaxID=663 RepID=A0A1W6W6S2_VIBAL|nr:hypothetical protein K01M1_05320 [Vibrio alginolyticus]ARO99971.1 hypothetical protein K01M1_31220 [Vibrio alginolyticus]ARP00006.1 hypothetical protein K01M1_31630 [Vibrio alginolyticus]ARP02253.1 hypothetical protein K04M1_05660 [Vibrio alginolyticus]ARP04687.1 hypothetical protein K04M1_31370 [Vibrio alginolyticus]